MARLLKKSLPCSMTKLAVNIYISKRSHFKVHGNAIGQTGQKSETENHPPISNRVFFPENVRI